MKNKKLPIIIAAILLLAAASFYYSTSVYSESRSTVLSDTTKAQTYICPMHSDITSDKPGSCSKCGMDLVLKNDDNGTNQQGMNMKDCMDKCKDMGCDMSKCTGESGACKGCGSEGGCKMMKDKDGKTMDGKDCKGMMDKDCKGMKDKDGKMGDSKDCKSKCMGK